MTDEQKRAAALLMGIGFQPTAHQASVVADFLALRERDAFRRAAEIATEEAGEYTASAEKLDANGRHDAATSDIHGELACKRVAERLRLMAEKPRK